jgi:hypothetical protein
MIDAKTVEEIIELYKKHGWILRRALLSPEAEHLASNIPEPFERFASDIDALWFSRQSKRDSETWELRRLSELPFALVAVVSTTASEDEIESTLDQVLDEMRGRTIA